MNVPNHVKSCIKCQIPKSLNCFHILSESKDGHRNICKDCRKIIGKQYFQNNKSTYRENTKSWRKNNPEKLKIYYKKDSIKRKNYFKIYRITHRKERAFYSRTKQLTDINYKLSLRLRHRVYIALKSKGIKKLHRTMDLLGCNIETFKSHLQSQFKTNMNWANYGKWHIDHIKPCANFDLTNPTEQKICFHYSNMQPLWAHENLQKWKN